MFSKEITANVNNGSEIRAMFEQGAKLRAKFGAENVFDYSLGNPSIPSPVEVNETIRQILTDTDSLALHGYTTAVGDLATRQAIADDLNSSPGRISVP